MKTVVCEESSSLGLAASNWCRDKIVETGARSIYVPAGATPVQLYDVWSKEQPAYLANQRLLQIDDVLTGNQAGVFKKFFQTHLPKHQAQMEFITNADVQADLAILGLGLNGHVAFHEPGLPPNFYGGCVKLGDITCDHLKMARGTWGISYGAGAFGGCRSILMMVSGASKRDILARFLAGDESLPVTALARHFDLTLVADRDALPTVSSGMQSGGSSHHPVREQKDHAAR